jgi:hypothetical protein
MGYLDGSLDAPKKKVAAYTAAGAELIPNPAYERCHDDHVWNSLH